MKIPTFEELLDAGVHFGHLKKKWNPAMKPYIFMEKDGIHIIDLHKTIAKLEEACKVVKELAKNNKQILFVATKKQARNIVKEALKPLNLPYIIERWPPGLITNFPTIRKAVRKMDLIDKMITNGTFDKLSKRERLQLERQRAKLEKNLGSIANMTRLPHALFIIDTAKEYIAVKEARSHNIITIGTVDTNCDPTLIDFPIPANDDASSSIAIIIQTIVDAYKEGLEERNQELKKSIPIQQEQYQTTTKQTRNLRPRRRRLTSDSNNIKTK